MNVLRQTSALLVLALVIASVEGASRESRRPTKSQEEEVNQKYEKPFFVILSAIFLSVAPVLVRFIHCLFTDPVIPILWKHLKMRGSRVIIERFGVLGQEREEEDVDLKED